VLRLKVVCFCFVSLQEPHCRQGDSFTLSVCLCKGKITCSFVDSCGDAQVYRVYVQVLVFVQVSGSTGLCYLLRLWAATCGFSRVLQHCSSSW